MKKTFILVLVFVMMASSFAYAQDEISESMVYQLVLSTIPAQMTPGTVISIGVHSIATVTEPLNMSIPVAVPDSPLDVESMTRSEYLAYQAEKTFLDSIESETVNFNIIHAPDPLPINGMVITYGSDGFISHIETNGISTQSYTALPQGSRKPIGTHTWGTANNTLVITSGAVTGTGRFTTFSDTYGESSNTLVKGDVATKGDYDNPYYGTAVNTRRLNSDGTDTNYSHIMYKRDNGSLPNAVLDIWKTGVEYYDLTYSSTLSFNGRYYYSTFAVA
jgi:hypothetical protein